MIIDDARLKAAGLQSRHFSPPVKIMRSLLRVYRNITFFSRLLRHTVDAALTAAHCRFNQNCTSENARKLSVDMTQTMFNANCASREGIVGGVLAVGTIKE